MELTAIKGITVQEQGRISETKLLRPKVASSDRSNKIQYLWCSKQVKLEHSDLECEFTEADNEKSPRQCLACQLP